MPTPTYTPLANITLGSSASSVTFSNIPNTYRDLILITDIDITAQTNGYVMVRVNGDTGSNYTEVFMSSLGPTSQSNTRTFFYNDYGVDVTGRAIRIYQFMDYAVTDKHKTVLGRSSMGASANGAVTAAAFRWASTSAITSIAFTRNAGNFNSGSTFALYGVIA